jgi:hypothetical protein
LSETKPVQPLRLDAEFEEKVDRISSMLEALGRIEKSFQEVGQK